jgi:DNA-binding response OmpR family regulator
MKSKKITTIMIIEESDNLRSVLKKYFETMNYKVIEVNDGESAIRSYKRKKCDICLLDTCLPNNDGYAVLKKLRNIDATLPVIFITSKDSKEDKIKGFTAGCDDYVTKPFSTDELLLRVEAVLRRCVPPRRELIQTTQDIIFHLGEIIFNYSELKLIKDEEKRKVTRKEAQILRILYENMNRLAPREVFVKEIWGEKNAAKGRSLDVFISKIRNHLLVEPTIKIISVHGMGYLLKVEE